MNYVVWNKTDPIKTPSGIVYTAEEFISLRVPYAAQGDEVILGQVNGVTHSFDSMSSLVDQFFIDPKLPISEKMPLIIEGIRCAADPNYSVVNEILDGLESEVGTNDDA